MLLSMAHQQMMSMIQSRDLWISSFPFIYFHFRCQLFLDTCALQGMLYFRAFVSASLLKCPLIYACLCGIHI